jgi:hypothetical protein
MSMSRSMSSADTFSALASDMPPRAATAPHSQDELLRMRRATAAATAARGRAVCADPLLYPQLPSGEYRYLPERCVRVRAQAPSPPSPASPTRPRSSSARSTRPVSKNTEIRNAAALRDAVNAMHVEARTRFMQLVISRPGAALAFRHDPREPFYVSTLYLSHALPLLRVVIAKRTLSPESLRRIDASWKNGILADPANADIAALCHEYLLRIYLLSTAT